MFSFKRSDTKPLHHSLTAKPGGLTQEAGEADLTSSAKHRLSILNTRKPDRSDPCKNIDQNSQQADPESPVS